MVDDKEVGFIYGLGIGGAVVGTTLGMQRYVFKSSQARKTQLTVPLITLRLVNSMPKLICTGIIGGGVAMEIGIFLIWLAK